jgi:hypothetical protein
MGICLASLDTFMAIGVKSNQSWGSTWALLSWGYGFDINL